MKTIEERAAEIFADRFCTRCPKILYTTCDRKLPGCCRIPEVRCMHEVIKNTIAFEREELTRWHDPKEELPEYYKVVEVKWYGSGLIRISTAWLSAGDAGGYLWTIEGTSRLINVRNILGWREIHE